MARAPRTDQAIMVLVGFTAILDTSFLIVVIAAYAESLGASEPMAGFISGLYSLVAIPASLAAGPIIDRVGRKRAISAGMLWDAALIYSYSLARNPLELAVVRGLHAVGGSLTYPAFIARAAETSGPNMGYSMARYLAPVALAVALGSGSGALMVSRLGFRDSFQALSAVILVVALLSLALRRELEETRWAGVRGVLEGIRGAGRSVAAGLWIIFSLYMGIGVVVGGLATALINEGVAASEEDAARQTGVLVSQSVLISVPLFLILGHLSDKRGLRGIILAGSILPAATLALTLAGGLHLTSLRPLFAAFGFTLAALLLSSTLLVVRAPPQSRGSAVALQQVSNIAGVVVGANAGGVLSGALGLAGVVAAFSASLLLALPVAIITPGSAQQR